NMLYECSIDEYNLRKFSPDYSIHLLQEALNLSNNSMDKEEINSKIALFQKKAETKKNDNPSDDGKLPDWFNFMIVILFLIFTILLRC
ncbi:MAG: hypothetical protein II939_02885, partial [Bacteroidales bacterium]|nr:hypothetical protein [Bacteroidales bacterium]